MSQVTKVFQSGNSQAVRLPKEFRFSVDEVEIDRVGDTVILRPIKTEAAPWSGLRAAIQLGQDQGLSDDFEREQPLDQERPGLDELFP